MQCSSLCDGGNCTGGSNVAGGGGCNRCFAIGVNNDNSQV